jgi:hypothetical protein
MKGIVSALTVSGVLAVSAISAFAAAPAPMLPAMKQRAQFAATRHGRDMASERRMTEALNLLEAKGYGAFQDFRPDGKDFAAAVTQGDRHFTVRIDPDTGQIIQQG